MTIFCLFRGSRHAIHGVFLQPCCGVFLRIWKSLEHISSQSFFHSWLVCWTKLQLLLGGEYHGALVDEGFCGLVLYIMCRVSPCVKTFQSPISRVLSLASSMKITSVNDVIIALLKALCLVTVVILPWCINPWIGKNKLVLPLFASPTRQGTLSLCCFLFYSITSGSRHKSWTTRQGTNYFPRSL